MRLCQFWFTMFFDFICKYREPFLWFLLICLSLLPIFTFLSFYCWLFQSDENIRLSPINFLLLSLFLHWFSLLSEWFSLICNWLPKWANNYLLGFFLEGLIFIIIVSVDLYTKKSILLLLNHLFLCLFYIENQIIIAVLFQGA